MSEETTQSDRPHTSRLSQMFGFVKPEDRSKWEQARAQNKPRVNSAKQGAKTAMGSMAEFGESIMRSKLSAAHRVAAQAEFEDSHVKQEAVKTNAATGETWTETDWKARDAGDDHDMEL